jgi:uncharacterized alpha-E superfamily protein
MLSRVAENLYWISRYVERAEYAVRLIDGAYHRELDAGLVGGGGPRPLAAVARLLGFTDAPTGREALLDSLTFDVASRHSIRAMIGRARENARGSQEALSAESWSQLNQLHLYLGSPRARARMVSSPFRFFDRVRRACVLFAALVDGTLARGEVFYFLQLGRSLERADLTARMVQSGLGDGSADSGQAVWDGLLRVCSAHEAYVQRYQDRVEPEGVVGVLVLAADFPRSVRYRVNRCLEALREIGGGPGLGPAGGTPAERRLGRLDGELRYTDAGEVCARGVGHFLAGVVDSCAQAGGEIQEAFFLT